ncbi:hypothetical protein DAPPUDRAFT_320734 [Daphnia pulex]|uniref:NACHT domain-containing protein n=1 Tax=Daphnia pulex TaxID=6669 RepID=E9GQ45_DAPPU|nr:hypothetical protein DAPPUDRAFT_320734 [Daphnia pulex]|eukprot:EFX78233.1 hypothetical protein DAPPUDRAFT_320734 [Daphnia pulex]
MTDCSSSIRGLSAGYKFELGKENEDLGGKFDDVIFRYEVPDETTAGKHWRYHYLQAKHKENENDQRKIKASDLLDPNPNGPFSLKKYFLSYCKMRERGDDVRDCIVCTNWDVNTEQFKKIQLEKMKQHEILKFAPWEKTLDIYKLKIDQNLRSETIKLLEVSDIVAMGMTVASLANKFQVQFRDDNDTTNSNEDKMLTIDLVTEKDVDSKTKKFRPDFINDENLSVDANKLRQKIVKVIDDFYSKLVFVVNMPNETQFKKIIETEDVSKYYPSDNRKIQTTRIFDEISDAFENKPANFWLTSEEAKKILLAGVTDVSSKYQKQLEEEVEFNEDAIKVMGRKLKHLIDSSGREKVERIATPSPRHTAVKVIVAVQIVMRGLKQEGNYLVVSASRLQNEEEKWKNILKLKNYSHHFYIVVCDNEASIQNYEDGVISGGKAEDNNFIIIISHDESSAGIKDEIKYTDLSEHFQKIILSKPISFQGENVKVGDLVGDQPEEVIDFSSTKELLLAENEIQIPSFNTSTFEQSLYVKRRLKFPFENQFELGGECRINSVGHIEWLVGKEKQKEVWEKIMNGLSNQASSTGKTINDIHLTNFEKKENEKSIVIIFGVAGTGKSTLLCHYYEEIKRAKPDHWVIRINLVDYEAVLKLDQITDLDVVDLFSNRLHVVDHNSQFFRSFLRKRLEKGDRIVVMFDGFDEINELCQKGAIEWIKAISKNKSIRLYVTTRTHMSGDLQFQLSQMAYSLENFAEKDQIDYLTSYWIKELNLSEDNDGSLQHFAQSLVERVSETLKDEEKSFIGIPLQCRILAECFQSNVKELITLNCAKLDEDSRQSVSDKISSLLDGEKFDLVKLYNLLMETKRRVFREEKAKTPSSVENKIVTDAINLLIKNVESHLTKLAIKTIVEDEKIVDVLWPPQLSHQSNEDVAAEEKVIAMNGLSFGLTIESVENKTTNATQFLHRTYAEYLFARYLYEGFLLDDERHNKLLENESIQKLILNKILSIKQYDGVQVFFNSMLKKLVDKDQEWRNRIIQRDLPERFTKFAKHFFTYFLRKYPSSRFPFKNITTENRSWIFPNALHYSLSTGKEKIFKFFCDSLDATFDKKLIQNAMMNSFMTNKSYFSFKFFRNTESELFKRFLGYLYSDDSKYPPSCDIVFNWHEEVLPPCNLEYSQWNGTEQQNLVRLLLEFIVNQRTTFDTHFSNIVLIVPMLTFLIFNENYEGHLEIFLKRLSRSTAYSDKSKFANLLKEAFCFKKHFVRGRIVKALTILKYKIDRHDVLTQLNAIVLAMEPEACQDVFRPIEEEGLKPADLHLLLERDSYRLTRLHRATFNGNTEAVEEMLGRISQNLTDPIHTNVADKIINEVVARDEFGFTPFYVAAACGHEEIYNKILAFLKQVLHKDTLEEHLIDEKGIVHRALSDAIQSENIQMFQLILKAVKKELGQKELIRVLNPELYIHPLERNSSMPIFFDRCKTKEFFNAMAKIVVTRDDNDPDYTDLYDLISHKYYPNTKRSLEDIDNENLQELLSLKGVEDFTKSVLDIRSLSGGFELLSRNLLKHFTKDQIEEFVQTMTSKKYTKKNRSFWVIPVDSAHVDDKEIKDQILLHLNFGEWTEDDLVFEDQGNGVTLIYAERLVSRPSYWRDYIEEHLRRNALYPDSFYMKLTNTNDGFPFREYVDRICECFKYVGDNSAKELLLHEETQSYIMIRFPQNMVKLMLNCLTQESQEEVKQNWKNNAPPMKTFLTLTSQTFSNEIFPARYCSAILHFYLEYGSEDHLKEFAKVVTVLHNINGVQHSLWSYVFENVDSRERNDILKLVSEKTDFIGRNDVKWLLIHEIDNVPFIIKAVSWGEDVDLWLEILPENLREEIQQFIQQNAPDFIEKAFRYPPANFKTFSWGHYHKRLNTFTFFLSYSNAHQLQIFVQKITSKRVGGQQGVQERSMWAEVFTHDWESNDVYGKTNMEDFAKMNKFMKMVSEKLGPIAVKELVLHQDGELLVVFYLALRGEEKMLETLLNYLPAKDRKKVQRKVDKFLDETYKIPQDDED